MRRSRITSFTSARRLKCSKTAKPSPKFAQASRKRTCRRRGIFAPSRICRARRRPSTRRWRKSRLNRRCEERSDEAIHFCCNNGLLRYARNDEKQSEEIIMSQAKRVVLASLPVGEPKPSDFRIEDYALPTPGQREVLLRTIWLSLDPYMRGRMSDGPSYAAPVPIGGVMEGGAGCEGVASNNPSSAQGDLVLAHTGGRRRALSHAKQRRKTHPKLAPVSSAATARGPPGITAYTGLLDIGKPQPGETVVVAAASGAVGSAVGQIAKIKGARAGGIAGGTDKWNY